MLDASTLDDLLAVCAAEGRKAGLNEVQASILAASTNSRVRFEATEDESGIRFDDLTEAGLAELERLLIEAED